MPSMEQTPEVSSLPFKTWMTFQGIAIFRVSFPGISFTSSAEPSDLFIHKFKVLIIRREITTYILNVFPCL